MDSSSLPKERQVDAALLDADGEGPGRVHGTYGSLGTVSGSSDSQLRIRKPLVPPDCMGSTKRIPQMGPPSVSIPKPPDIPAIFPLTRALQKGGELDSVPHGGC